MHTDKSTLRSLRRIARFKDNFSFIRAKWIPGHSRANNANAAGNHESDRLARVGSALAKDSFERDLEDEVEAASDSDDSNDAPNPIVGQLADLLASSNSLDVQDDLQLPIQL